MPFRVSGKNIEVGEALRERISARVLEALEKYFDGGFSGHVTVGKEAFGFNTECVVHLDSGIVLRADSMAADAYLSADQAAEKLEKRLRRYHGKLKDYHANGRNNGHAADEALAPDYVIAAPWPRRQRGGLGLQSGDHRRIDHGAEAAFGQRSRHATRYDRRSGHGFPARQPRPGQPGLPPFRRQYRVDRSARHSKLRAIDGRDDGPYGPPPFNQAPVNQHVPDRFQCRPPISFRRTRSSRP